MSDVIIIGNGPAGISAALYTVRSGLKTTVIGNGLGALGKADKIENFYGFAEPVSGKELFDNGIEQASRLSVNIIKEQVTGLGLNEKISVKTANNEFSAGAVILATGSSRKTPNIKGLKEFEGKGISYCAVCDAFFYRGKDVAVLGCCDYALSEAVELSSVAKSVTIITNGVKPSENIPANIKVIETGIAEFSGDEVLHSVLFNDGKSLQVSGVFIAIGIAGSSDLAKKIGAETSDNIIIVNDKMETNIPGLYAAGDCTGGMFQISKAVYEGAVAGTEAVKYLRKTNYKKSSLFSKKEIF